MSSKISIIIPVYNIQDYVAHCLDSVLAQTYHNLEIIVVNDGSRDGTPAILDDYAGKDSRVKVIHKENGGVTSARLRGIEEATGDWIGFVDGDDYVEPEMFERLLKNAIRYHADISHCGYQMVLPQRVDYYYNTGRLVQQDSREALKDLFVGKLEPGLGNKLFHHSLLRNLLYNDLVDVTIKINEDLLMNYYLFRKAEKTVFEDFCPYHYMVRAGSAATSRINGNKIRDPIKVRRILAAETAGDAELCSLARQSLMRLLVRFASMPMSRQAEDIRMCIKEARRELRKEITANKGNTYISCRLKLQALWAAIWPASYGAIHSIYGEISGAAHKYDVQ